MKALTAPMGWNSWDCYGAAVTEDIVRQNADFMAKNLKQQPTTNQMAVQLPIIREQTMPATRGG